MKTKFSLLQELTNRTAVGVQEAKKRTEQESEDKNKKKIEADLLIAEEIILNLPESMRKTADRGERKHLVVHNIDPLCFEAVAKIVSYLESQEIRTERVPDMDPGSDTNWTELWAEW